VPKVSHSLSVASRTFTTVVIADRGSARRPSFASSIGPAVVSAGVAVVGSRRSGRRKGGRERSGRSGRCSSRRVSYSALVLKRRVQHGNSVAKVSRGLNVTVGTFASVVVADGSSARRRSFASSIGPAVVGAGVAVVSGRGSCGSKGGCSRGGCRGGCLGRRRRSSALVN
jgi:hypothetical protein